MGAISSLGIIMMAPVKATNIDILGNAKEYRL